MAVCVEGSELLNHVPLWWISTITLHLLDDLWGRSLHELLPKDPPDAPDDWAALRRNYIAVLASRSVAEIDLWPSQLEAAERVWDESDGLVAALPTSSGKTRIAELCILRCLADGRRCVYVAPLRALSAQIEERLGTMFGPLGFDVTALYGDAGTDADLDPLAVDHIVVVTPEKLDFAVRQAPDVIDDVGLVVLDEGHMIGLGEREVRYEILVQRLLRRGDAAARRLVCLSAVFSPGDAFDDFCGWVCRRDAPRPIQSEWRPTRQRFALLEWTGTRGRLSFRDRNGQEQSFVPRFIERQSPAGKQRKKPLPADEKELTIAAMTRYVANGDRVLVYSPSRRQIEPFAKMFSNLCKQGHIAPLPIGRQAAVNRAVAVAKDGLGEDHSVTRALGYGLAVHHGQLPRELLRMVERLLRDGDILSVVSSPTLAQGVDLGFRVLLFLSLKRGKEQMPAPEFANVVGRVGRAFVDTDGLVVLPVFHGQGKPHRADNRTRGFKSLVRSMTERELESGLVLLVQHLVDLLIRAGHAGDAAGAAEYLLNQRHRLPEEASAGYGDAEGEADSDKIKEGLAHALAELDAALLALLGEGDHPADQLARRLDEVLDGSMWAKRTLRLESAREQREVLLARARHIWSKSTASQRLGFYAANVGHETGSLLLEQSADLTMWLRAASEALEGGDTAGLVENLLRLQRQLEGIYPFIPDRRVRQHDESVVRRAIEVWISASPLASLPNAKTVGFVQDALVYRLVWAIEACRVLFTHTGVLGEREASPQVAACLTHGVDTMAAARLVELGVPRVAAGLATTCFGLQAKQPAEAREWLLRVTEEPRPDAFPEDRWIDLRERAGALRRRSKAWSRETVILSATLDVSVEVGDRVSVSGTPAHAAVYDSDGRKCGELVRLPNVHFEADGEVLSRNEIRTEVFLPSNELTLLRRAAAGGETATPPPAVSD